MDVCEDRPISVYDNLTMPSPGVHSSTPKKKTQPTSMNTMSTSISPVSATATAAITVTTAPASVATGTSTFSMQTNSTNNGTTTHSPYSDISFKFNDNVEKQQQQQQQQQQQHLQSRLLPNGSNESFLKSSQQSAAAIKAIPPSVQVQPTANYYSTPYKLTANTTTTPQPKPQQSNNPATKLITTTAPTTKTAQSNITSPAAVSTPITTITTITPEQTTAITAITPLNAFPASKTVTSMQRPLSQHLKAGDYETSHSIAAVKAALNDAKSKFFGLDGYGADAGIGALAQTTIGGQTTLTTASPTDYNNLNKLNETDLLLQSYFSPDENKVQINKPQPPPKPKPKYQNIPENSAIFRNQQQEQQQQQQQQQQPPELPPKPNEQLKLKLIGAANAIPTTTPLTINDYNGIEENLPATLPQFRESTAETERNETIPIRKVHRGTSPINTNTNSMAMTQQQIQPQPQPQPQSQPHLQMNQQTGKNLTAANQYRQIPLNDIDNSQPSQAVYMTTTVPQNIKGSKIAGRHTPTRNSLRHSRMLVVNNKNYQGIQHPNPMNFKHPNFARWFLILKLIIGILISFLSIWIFFLAPNTSIQDNPYWSGLALILSGILGLLLVRYQRSKRHKMRENCFMFIRANSYLISLISLLLCIVALLCASIHFARLTADDTKCVSTNPLLEQGSCTCTFNAVITQQMTNRTLDDVLNSKDLNGDYDAPLNSNENDEVNEEIDNFDDHSYKVEYRELSCIEVTGEWTYLLSISMILNGLGFFVAVSYIILLACDRHDTKRFYATVHTSTF